MSVLKSLGIDKYLRPIKNVLKKTVKSDTKHEIQGSGIIKNLVFITQADYDNGTPNENTLYVIID